MARAPVEPENRSKTRTLSCYDKEWDALKTMASGRKLKTRFDVVRSLVAGSSDPSLKKVRDAFKPAQVKG